MKPLVIARPEPGNAATAQAARSLGLDAVCAPLFEVQPISWTVDKSIPYDGILITSANSLACAGSGLDALKSLPLFAVGPASAAAAHAAGFRAITTGQSDGQALADLAAAHGLKRVLHLAGDPFKPLSHPGLTIDVCPVYRVVEIAPPAALVAALARPCVVLAHSPRMARRLAALASAHADIDLVAISAQAAHAAGEGWKSVSWPDVPESDAMLDRAALLCRAA